MIQGTDYAQWLMLAIFTSAIIIIWYTIKKYLENNRDTQKEHTVATKELTKSNTVLAEKLNSFQIHCAYIETNNTKQLDSHSTDIGKLRIDTTRIDTKVQEHEKRLYSVEQKKVV